MSDTGNISIQRGFSFWIIALLALTNSVFAAETKEELCAEVARKAQKTLWNSVHESADELFCRKPWVSRRPDELAACALANTSIQFGNRLKNKWNAFFDKAGAEWASLGPRGISVDWEEGTITKGFKRTFFGPALAYNKTTVEVVKEGGRAEANITVCVLDYDNKVVNSIRKTFASEKGNENESRVFELENLDNRIVGVVVDTPVSINSFEYRARLKTEPIKNNLRDQPGIADLHVHQLVNLTFGGRMYWGQHAGDKATALGEEIITGPINPSLMKPDELSTEQLVNAMKPGVDANVAIWAAKPGKDDEGYFILGGGGHPKYEKWPHHADRSHQQVHVSWLKEAHERGKNDGTNLNLMVVSLVNNDILCSAMKTIDPYGNVPIRDSSGKVTGWESANWGCTDHENVMRQLEAIHQLERENPWYRVAMTPWHARQIIADGDLAVIISLETDKPLSSAGGNYGKWLDQLDAYRAMGVTTMQIVHESNSRFCGAAAHRDLMGFLQLIHWPVQSMANILRSRSPFNLDGERYNGLGITKDGEELVDALVKRNMPIDLAHGSQRCRVAVMSRVPENYGLYDSHTKFKRLLEPSAGKDYGTDVLKREQEFLIMESILPAYVKRKVLVGLRTSSVDIYDAPNAKVANNCPGSANSFAQLVQYATDSGLDIAFGTDFNTGVSQLGPRFGVDGACWADLVDKRDKNAKRPVKSDQDKAALPPRATQIAKIDGTNYYTDGLSNIGWLPELTYDLINDLKTPGAQKLKQSAEAYLRMWERTYTTATSTTTIDETPVPSLAMGVACTGDNQCRSGKCSSIAGARGVCVCNADGDCGSGNFCNMGLDTKVNACESLKSDNETCSLVDGGRTCKSGQCKLGRCYTPASVAMGGECYVNDACAKGKCSSIDGTKGSCVCDADGDCGSGLWCDQGADLKINACKRKLDKGEVCGTIGELGVGHRCKSGDCKISLGANLKCK